MLNLLFLFATLCGTVMVWFVHGQIGDCSLLTRYSVTFITILALFYGVAWLNSQLLKKEATRLGDVEQKFSLSALGLQNFHLKKLKHSVYKVYSLYAKQLLIICAAALLTYGLESNAWFVVIVALFPALFWANMFYKNQNADPIEDTLQTHEPKEAPLQDSKQTLRHDNAIHQAQSPDVNAKMAASEIIRQVQNMVKAQEGRIRMESMLCALGALAGYACQRTLLMDVLNQKDGRSESIKVIRTDDGASFFDGEPLNYFLFRSSHSIWELALAHVRLEEELPDLDDIVLHTRNAMGTPEFGIPILSENHKTPYLPVEYVKMMWPTIFSMMRLICQNPHEWATAFGFAIQKVVDEYKDQLIMGAALTIVMESAVPMSRISLFEHFSKQQLL